MNMKKIFSLTFLLLPRRSGRPRDSPRVNGAVLVTAEKSLDDASRGDGTIILWPCSVSTRGITWRLCVRFLPRK